MVFVVVGQKRIAFIAFVHRQNIPVSNELWDCMGNVFECDFWNSTDAKSATTSGFTGVVLNSKLAVSDE